MLLPNMSLTEVYEEVSKDFEGISQEIYNKGKSFIRFVKKTTRRFPIVQEYNFTTRERNNKGFITFHAAHRGSLEQSMYYSLRLIWDNAAGRNTISINERATNFDRRQYGLICIETAHLYGRYRERFLKDQEVSNDHVIRSFHLNNPRSYGTDISEDLMPGSPELEDLSKRKLAYVYTEGVAFGVVAEENVVLLKTFVSFDMLFPKQIEIFAPMRESLLRNLALPPQDSISHL